MRARASAAARPRVAYIAHVSSPPPPPYGLLATPTMPFPALAALAGRAPIGETRETVLACLLAARLVRGTLPPYALTAEARRARAAATAGWLAALALPAAARPALLACCELSASGPTPALERALHALTIVAAPALDDAAASELTALRRSLADVAARDPHAAPPPEAPPP